jgi:hypothetical protein
VQPFTVAIAVWAAARVCLPYGPFLTAMADCLVSRRLVRVLPARALSALAWAVATMGFLDRPLMAHIALYAMRDSVLFAFSPDGLAYLMWAFARLRVRHLDLFLAVRRRLQSEGFLSRCGPRALTVMLWATAVCDRTSDAVPALLAAASTPEIVAALRGLHVATLLWALARLGLHSHPLVSTLIHQATQPHILQDFTAQSVANAAWACMMLQCGSAPLEAALLERATHPEVLQSLNRRDLETLWAFFSPEARERLAAAIRLLPPPSSAAGD